MLLLEFHMYLVVFLSSHHMEGDLGSGFLLPPLLELRISRLFLELKVCHPRPLTSCILLLNS